MFHKLHYYDGFYLDDRFWDSVAGKGRMRRKGLTKAVGEMPLYGLWWNDHRLFMRNYEWCKSNGIVKSWQTTIEMMGYAIGNTFLHWRNNVYFMEGDGRCRAVEDAWNPFRRLSGGIYCFEDALKNDYARFYFNGIDDETDGYAIEIASLFDFEMEKDEHGAKAIYTFKCLNENERF